MDDNTDNTVSLGFLTDDLEVPMNTVSVGFLTDDFKVPMPNEVAEFGPVEIVLNSNETPNQLKDWEYVQAVDGFLGSYNRLEIVITVKSEEKFERSGANDHFRTIPVLITPDRKQPVDQSEFGGALEAIGFSNLRCLRRKKYGKNERARYTMLHGERSK